MALKSHNNDYSRYFGLRQKVYLINVSAGRNCEIYESLSGFVTASNVDVVELMITHSEPGTHDADIGTATYKLTSEALGSGIQVLANLTGIVAGNIFQFRLHGALEMFQRRTVPRIVLSARIHHLRKDLPLDLFKKEWKRVVEHLRHTSVMPRLILISRLLLQNCRNYELLGVILNSILYAWFKILAMIGDITIVDYQNCKVAIISK